MGCIFTFFYVYNSIIKDSIWLIKLEIVILKYVPNVLFQE